MKSQRILTFLMAIVLVLSACNLPSSNKPVNSNPNAIFTAAAQTVEVQLTQNVLVNPTVPPPTVAPPTSNAPAATDIPSLPLPTSASSATATVPASAATAVPTKACDSAQFIVDVTVPDGTNYDGGAAFTKTWKLKNTGTCTWDSTYGLVFDTGDQMGGPATQPLAASVAPNQAVDLSVALQAPAAAGTYRGYWRLRNASGTLLPVANGYGGKSFYVEIKVGGGSSGGKFAVNSVSFTVSHSGACGSGKYTVQAAITANGPGEVTYYWIRSDGATDTETHSPVVFTAAGSQTVSTEWNTSATGLWMDIYIDKPNHQQIGRGLLNCP
jgi:hypothetical protein